MQKIHQKNTQLAYFRTETLELCKPKVYIENNHLEKYPKYFKKDRMTTFRSKFEYFFRTFSLYIPKVYRTCLLALLKLVFGYFSGDYLPHTHYASITQRSSIGHFTSSWRLRFSSKTSIALVDTTLYGAFSTTSSSLTPRNSFMFLK